MPATTTRKPFLNVRPDVHLFEVRPGIPLKDALEQLELLLECAELGTLRHIDDVGALGSVLYAIGMAKAIASSLSESPEREAR